MIDDVLLQIQQLQFSDRAAAEALLLDFVRQNFPLDVAAVELRPQAVSLNSFNGFLRLSDGSSLFFKTHVERDNVIDEYYNAALLAQAGYPVIQPLFGSGEAGKHLLIYEVVEDPSMFDLAWAIETGDSASLDSLTAAQNAADDHLMRLYLDTLKWQSAPDAASAPIHQLYYHRLAHGRLERFYGGDATIMLPDGIYPAAEVRAVRWVVNGAEFASNLNTLIESAIALLNPFNAGPSIIGHGDAHNGNVFCRLPENRLAYFDPAFAGRHDPLLDLVKPLFHNVFAMWMYFPQVKRQQLAITVERDADVWRVAHNHELHPVRLMFLYSKVERVLMPILSELKRRKWLRRDWRACLKAALFCCPFVTMNLADSSKFPPEISLLGLAMSVEMGAESRGRRSLIDTILDEAEQRLV